MLMGNWRAPEGVSPPCSQVPHGQILARLVIGKPQERNASQKWVSPTKRIYERKTSPPARIIFRLHWCHRRKHPGRACVFFGEGIRTFFDDSDP